jgi:hypothetical protein
VVCEGESGIEMGVCVVWCVRGEWDRDGRVCGVMCEGESGIRRYRERV